MRTKTLQEQYNLIKEGKGSKDSFLKEAKRLFPNFVNNAATFNQASTILKQKSVINENFLGMVSLEPINSPVQSRPEENWESRFKNYLAEEAKAEEKKTTKEVDEVNSHGYDTADKKNVDNMIADQYRRGVYAEAKAAPEKTLEEIEKIVAKNLAKDPIFYTKNAAFGVKGLGYTDDAPSLGATKEVKGKYAASGMEIVKESMRQIGGIVTTPAFNTISLSALLGEIEEGYDEFQRDDKGAKGVDKKDKGEEDAYGAGVEKGEEIEKKKMKKESVKDRVKEIEKQGSIAALEAKMNAIDEEINERQSKLDMVSENDAIAEFINPARIKEINREIKELEKAKGKYEKMHEKMTGSKKREIVDEEVIDEMDAVSWNEKNNPTRNPAVGERDPQKVGQSTSDYAVNEETE